MERNGTERMEWDGTTRGSKWDGTKWMTSTDGEHGYTMVVDEAAGTGTGIGYRV